MTASAALDATDRDQLCLALCSTRGRYLAERASQLSGVPKTTVYYWAREGFLVPDHYGMSPKRWSYRDLVLLRLFAWLRERSMNPADARDRVEHVRRRLDTGVIETGRIRSDGAVFLHGDEAVDRMTGVQLFSNLVAWVEEFDLFMPITDKSGRSSRWKGPNLLHPSRHTAISAWVLGGEPCVANTRIPTASLFSLSNDRCLDTRAIHVLYPAVSETGIKDAVALEHKLRIPASAV